MPHLFSVNQIKNRHHRAIRENFKIPALVREHFTDYTYLIGGISFIVGSVFFLPEMGAFGDTGVWIFIIGSLLYLMVTMHDLIISRKLLGLEKNKVGLLHIEFYSVVAYTVGTLTYLLGSILFLSSVDEVYLGAICFIIGSSLFMVGATMNVLEIIKESSMMTLQLINGTAITYIMGSLLFFVASIPYIWQGISIHDQNVIYNYVAWEYIGGSVFFTIGAAFSLIRTYIIKKEVKS